MQYVCVRACKKDAERVSNNSTSSVKQHDFIAGLISKGCKNRISVMEYYTWTVRWELRGHEHVTNSL